MLERLRFRYKILLLVGPALLGLLLVTAIALVLNRRAEAQVARVQDTYLPLLELDRDLKRIFSDIQRKLEGAAAAQDHDGLAEADDLQRRFLHALDAARAAVAANGQDANALRRDMEDYYRTARDVTVRLLGGQAGEALVDRMERMQERHARLTTRLESTATPDRTRMAGAFAAARQSYNQTLVLDLLVAGLALAVAGLLSFRIIGGTVRSLQAVQEGVERLARGDFGQEIRVASLDEFGDLARQGNETALRLREYREKGAREDWLKTGLIGLTTELAGEQSEAELARRSLVYLARYLEAPVAALYLVEDDGALHLCASHAFVQPEGLPATFKPGEGLLGEALQDGQLRVLDQPPGGHLLVRSALVEAAARQIVVAPFAHEHRVLGVVELGRLTPWSEQQLEGARGARDVLAVAFAVARSRRRQSELLERSQRQAEELQAQQEELRQINDELARQSEALEVERASVLDKNAALEDARQMVQDKADEVARASRYKSEFLANMSHELRTPLNGILVLSQMLSENSASNLSAKQVEFATVIHRSGQELLTLINEVLDLSKVEAGRQQLVREEVGPEELATYLRGMWSPLAARKGLLFSVEAEADLPEHLHTDRMRVEQILKNLLSNALKFTEKGQVAVRLRRAPAREVPAAESGASAFLAIAVTDSGVGVPPDKQEWIFEAFAQADGTTSRKFGGTGLGLAIARKLAVALGGDLRVSSDGKKGSTFTLYLPLDAAPAEETRPPAPASPPEPVRDDESALRPGEPCLLVIDDDKTFIDIALALCRQAGFKCLVADRGESGLAMARRHRPSGIILDVGLPDMDGWSVMERLRMDPITRGIPVHFISAAEGADRARSLGAVGFLSKPHDADQLRSAIRNLEQTSGVQVRKVLMVEDDADLRAALTTLIASKDIEVVAVGTGEEAFQQLCDEPFGCLVLDLGLPDKRTGMDLLARLRAHPRTSELATIVHTGFPLTAEEVSELEKQPQTVVVLKGERSPQRLMEEVRLFVHRVRRKLPEQRQRLTEVVHNKEPALEGKRVLIVDDDMRNVYSLSAVLRDKGLQVEVAADGQGALDKLSGESGIELVLMDIMMPGMDGYEAIRRIRAQPGGGKLPIIALTAKAMPGDRQKCLDAGASDYVTKPVEVQQFLSTLRVWLSAEAAHSEGRLR